MHHKFVYFFVSDIVIAALDATEAQDIATKYGVSGYPTIKFFPKGSTTPEDYNGGRTADTIVKYIFFISYHFLNMKLTFNYI
jgi:hypothetical protein